VVLGALPTLFSFFNPPPDLSVETVKDYYQSHKEEYIPLVYIQKVQNRKGFLYEK